MRWEVIVEGVAVVESARRDLAPEVVGKAEWEFTPVVAVEKAEREFTPVVAAEKAEREFTLAVAEKAGRGLTPTVKNTGEDMTMQVVLNTWVLVSTKRRW